MLKDKIKRLQAVGLGEAEIVHSLAITHLACRRHMKKPDSKLPQGARKELYYSSLREGCSLHELMDMYKCSYSQIHQALYNKPKEVPQYTKEAALEHLQQHDDIDKLASHFGITKAALPHVLSSVGWHIAPDSFALTSDLAQYIIKAVRHNPELTYREIAEMADCDASYVTQVARSHGIVRQEQQKHDWPKIMEFLKENSVTATAAHFGTSRASIYYHKLKSKKQCHR